MMCNMRQNKHEKLKLNLYYMKQFVQVHIFSFSNKGPYNPRQGAEWTSVHSAPNLCPYNPEHCYVNNSIV